MAQPKKQLTMHDVEWIAFWLKADANDVKQQLKDDGYTIQETNEGET